MCLILFAYQQNPSYPLIIAANRDEFFDRPTQSAHFWNDSPSVLAGRDLLGGGTWMGMTRCGRFAAVTNYREPREVPAQARSRGLLCSDYLQTDVGMDEYLQSLADQRQLFAGYNLLIGDFSNPRSPRLGYFSNRLSGPPILLSPGVHGISNGLLNDHWPKVDTGKCALESQLSADTSALLDILLDSETAAPGELPDTGIEKLLEEQLSARFIKMDNYGTRSSTILRIDRRGQTEWLEQTFAPGGAFEQRQHIHFTIRSADSGDR